MGPLRRLTPLETKAYVVLFCVPLTIFPTGWPAHVWIGFIQFLFSSLVFSVHHTLTLLKSHHITFPSSLFSIPQYRKGNPRPDRLMHFRKKILSVLVNKVRNRSHGWEWSRSRRTIREAVVRGHMSSLNASHSCAPLAVHGSDRLSSVAELMSPGVALSVSPCQAHAAQGLFPQSCLLSGLELFIHSLLRHLSDRLQLSHGVSYSLAAVT
ncbi:hypothetical protein H6P81_013419 [Aristolochia fimbriata]|uniref:Uncharacterized protein n=1 Tax=Aristolochia fimbriata TaxID=158543 RepID=A0AAV7EFV2_ARIFI|nr:hypothetical protein H6P81_013419 [Aristolochia fimbriata]